MCFIYKWLIWNTRNNLFLIIGLFLGVVLSSFMSQIIRNKCIFTSEFEVNSKLENARDTINDDYEPVINLAGKPLKAQKTPKEFQRPRYYRTELGIRDKLFAGILTSTKTVKDFGIAFNKTTNHLFDKVVFFSESEPISSKSDIKLNGVVQFTDSRHALKPFHMFKYIVDNFLDEFDYFFLVRDKTYVRGRELYNMVKKISVSQTVHIGNGKVDKSNMICSLNTGILLSNDIIHKISLKLDWCVKNAFSNSDDINVNKCIVHSSGVGCKTSAQGLQFSSFEFSENVKNIDFEAMENNDAFNSALTFWPVSSKKMFLELHSHFSKVDLLKRKVQISLIRTEIIKHPVILPNNVTVKISWPIGNQPSFKPANRFDLLRWDYFNEKKIFLKTDFSNVEDLIGADLIDIKYIINASVEFVQQKHGDNFIYISLINGYRRFDPSRGMDYILDLAFKNVNTGIKIVKRIEICKPLGKVELIPMSYVTENTRINMIVVARKDNKEGILKFMENYVSVCMEKRDKTFLMLVLLYGAQHPGKGSKDDIFADIKEMIVHYSERFRKDNSKIAWLSVKLPDEKIINSGLFSRDEIVALNEGIFRIALLDLVVKKFDNDNLILYCTSNMEIRQDYLNRVRMNTIKDRQIFSPIPFSEFDPDIVYSEDFPRPKELDINRNYGHYDTLNTEHISFYVKDYREARKTIEEFVPVVHTDKDLSELIFYYKKKLIRIKTQNKNIYITGKIKENFFIKNLTKISLNSVITMFIRFSNLNVLRAVEPGLRLRHIMRNCQEILTQNDVFASLLYKQCIERRNFNSGSRSQLGHFILQYLNLNDCDKE